MESQPPKGPEGGEPFPTFDPSFGAPERPRRPQQTGASRPTPRGPRRGPSSQASPVLVGVAVGLVLATISVVIFFLLNGGEPNAASTSTTSSTSTTEGDNTSTTTQGDTSSTTLGDGSSTLVTVPGTGINTIVPVGDPIPIAELTMSADDIGPLDFGDPANDVLGRLAATFGQPTDDTGFIVGSGSFGECPGESIRVVRWGPLNIVVKGEASNAVFASYGLDLKYGGITSPTTDMATLSGLRVADTVADLNTIYGGYVIEYVVDQDAGMTFELRVSQNDELPLLWGPIESTADDARVTGIYSPDSCAREASQG